MLGVAAVALLLAAPAITTNADDAVHWGYEGEIAPEHWADLSPDFAICRNGRNQSPIDIDEPVAAALQTLSLDYRGRTTSITNNGHTLEIAVEPGNWLRMENERYELQQFHFHSPSEHSIRGEHFPLEAHFVHRGENGELAVVGYFFRVGEVNTNMLRFGAVAPREVGGSAPMEVSLAELNIDAEITGYYRYSGSLTTPPCSEGVQWLLAKQVGHMSSDQVKQYISVIGEDARGAQPVNARLVVER